MNPVKVAIFVAKVNPQAKPFRFLPVKTKEYFVPVYLASSVAIT
jgi:hypothetical protein